MAKQNPDFIYLDLASGQLSHDKYNTQRVTKPFGTISQLQSAFQKRFGASYVLTAVRTGTVANKQAIWTAVEKPEFGQHKNTVAQFVVQNMATQCIEYSPWFMVSRETYQTTLAGASKNCMFVACNAYVIFSEFRDAVQRNGFRSEK